MGGIIKAVFGGSTSKSQQQSTQESGNHNEDLLTSTFSPITTAASGVADRLKALLGLGGDGDQAAARADFQNTPGYQFARQQGLSGVSQAGYARGLGNSGATLKALDKYGTGLADQTYNSYMDKLAGLGSYGLQAGQLVGQAGQYSKGQSTGSSSTSTYSGGLGKALGFGMSMGG